MSKPGIKFFIMTKPPPFLFPMKSLLVPVITHLKLFLWPKDGPPGTLQNLKSTFSRSQTLHDGRLINFSSMSWTTDLMIGQGLDVFLSLSIFSVEKVPTLKQAKRFGFPNDNQQTKKKAAAHPRVEMQWAGYFSYTSVPSHPSGTTMAALERTCELARSCQRSVEPIRSRTSGYLLYPIVI